MFNDYKIDTVLEVVNDIMDIVNSKHIAASRAALTTYSEKLKGNKKEVLDLILSCAVQYNKKAPICRYNLIPVNQNQLEVVDELLQEFNQEKFKQLPHQLQKLVYLCSNTTVYRMGTPIIRKLISKLYLIEVQGIESNKCKRCYTDTEDTLCQSCIDKIESCTKYAVESFSTVGTTVESFEYYFKDWKVNTNTYGEYTFTRLNDSTETYQQNLPFKEFQNLSILIG